MKNTFGNNISVTLFGESHGDMIGAVLDGLGSGHKIDESFIHSKLQQRRPYGAISTARQEKDEFSIVSGVKNGITTGAPLTVLIKNENTRSKDYSLFKDSPRPSHADYVAKIKYQGAQDERGGGHFSGRLTAPIVAIGAILQSVLASKGIYIGTHIKMLHGIYDRELNDLSSDIAELAALQFPVLDKDAAKKMESKILEAGKIGNSVGGVLESVVVGLTAGVGEPWFDSLEGTLSHALFSIPGIKGVEFGLGFGFAEKYGSEANDPFATDGERIFTLTNNNGGINGGISNGMPIIFRVAVRPTPSIFTEQQTVSLSKMENVSLKIEGRHDPAIIHRVRSVVDAIAAIAIADALATSFGVAYLGG